MHRRKMASLYLFATIPMLEPVGQRAAFAKAGEPMINGIVIAPHHVGQGAIGYEGFDAAAIKPQVALHVEAVGAARDRTLGINWAGAGSKVEQRASDGARPLAGQGGHVYADFLESFRREGCKAFPQ